MAKKNGFWQSFALIIGYLAVVGPYLLFPSPVYGPLIGIAFGCAAFTIAIQQIYAYSANSVKRSERIVYFWSGLTLFLFGAGTVAACLPNMTQIELSPFAQKTSFGMSAILLVLGSFFLFRFSAAYLYRKESFLSDNYFVVFKDMPPNDQTGILELVHAAISVISLIAASACFLNYWIVPFQITAASPVYFPFFPSLKACLCLVFLATAAFSVWFFWAKYKRVKFGEQLDGLLFMTAMAVLFYVPCWIQITSRALPQYESAAVIIWIAVLTVAALIIVMRLGPELTSRAADTRNHSRILKAILLPIVTLVIVLVWLLLSDNSLFESIPFFFLTLGFLTLACAYLPINDLERLSESTVDPPQGTGL